MRPIQVRQNGSSCFIRWTYQEERYSLTWGSWTDKVERARLEYCAKLIYQDCLIGEFDPTLSKYRCWLEGLLYSGSNGNSKPTPKMPPLLLLMEQRLEEYYNNADDSLLRNLKNFGKEITNSNQAKEFMSWLKERGTKPSTQKRYLTILQVLRKDLFGDLDVKVSEKPRPRPFNVNEVDRILNSLKNDPYYSYYHDFIMFLFNTGLRVSEAIGIRWQDIDLDKREIHVYESLARGKHGSRKRERKSTKTSKYRCVPINHKVYEMLISRPKKEDLVFTSPTGLPLDDNSIGQRCWRKTLKNTGIPHRPLYNTRATFISHCISSGIPPHEVAEIVGNSPEVIFKHYLGSIRKPKLPEL